ncbi:septal ring lytic transglycosylase RlpA family protein [Brucella gallinifaecis]|uniref:Endolytic peptidoglycan transglycosylase RlpA n=1 Tax=Brucella gallinifaecis TaxID=215590 RepID=A0A502BPZ5_9HYPH|nr:septal ring lytic transglycosylase RlpA family protein [Brucella gallinifaecis]TPF75890.1 septal ring lytic transglycosylase RlpA family protein [Brucella gallinifaecis]
MISNGWQNRAGNVGQLIKCEKRGSVAIMTFMALAVALAGCSSTPQTKPSKKKQSKEYFAESKYGVKASPRVTGVQGKPLPRGGGRNQVGKPYQVKGRWYYPKENKNYTSTGRASWYGSAFHGRLTANGEIYDMTHLTAAHPTMPLPSYARVTNTYNGHSIIVRVNDRGPFARNRVIDLSQKAAEMLDYQHHGTANVKVEYVGRAPLHGQDDAYLMASFQPGNADSIGQPATGVMMAMNAPTPTPAGIAAMPVPQNSPFEINPDYSDNEVPLLPANVPVPSERPTGGFGVATVARLGGLGYASENMAASAYAGESTYGNILTANAVSDAWKRRNDEEKREYVELGVFNRLEDAVKLEKSLPRSAHITRTKTPTEQGGIYELTAFAAEGNNDDLLRAAWKAGAMDAFIVRAD